MQPKLLLAERFVDKDTGCSYRYVHSTTEYFRPHYHDYYEIFICLDGSATHLINDEQISLCKGDTIFIRPSDIHDYVCNTESFSMLNITFTEETVEDLFAYIGKEWKEHLLSAPLPISVTLTDTEIADIEADMIHIRLIEGDKKVLKSALRYLIMKLTVDKILFRSTESKEIDAPKWLIDLRNELREDKNFIEGISVLPRLTKKSREHVSRCMKKYYGVTMSEYINDLRLSYIANMLIYSNHDLIDIIYESGFGSVSWCYKCFEKKYGTSMSKYRSSGAAK